MQCRQPENMLRLKRIASAATALILAGMVVSARGQTQAGVGFNTVAEALRALKSTPGVQISAPPSGWVIISDGKNDTQWSFTPPDHYAYPAVIKRILKKYGDGKLYSEMTALCEA